MFAGGVWCEPVDRREAVVVQRSWIKNHFSFSFCAFTTHQGRLLGFAATFEVEVKFATNGWKTNAVDSVQRFDAIFDHLSLGVRVQSGSCSLVLQVGPSFDFFGFRFQRFKPAEIVADFKAVDRFGQGIEAGRGRGWHFAENGR